MLLDPQDNIKMGDGGNEEPLAASSGNGRALGNPLKKKQSLTRLFSSASKKSSRSRPSSREGRQSPPTPQVPPHFWPQASKTSGAPRIPSMSFNRLMSGDMNYGQSEDVSPWDGQSPGTSLPRPTLQEMNTAETNIIANSRPGTARRTSTVGINANETPRMAKAARVKQTEQSPILQHQTGLRTASVPTHRGRGASATVPKPKGSVMHSDPIRPATAGVDVKSRPTGKRKVNGRNVGQDGTIASVFGLEDFSYNPQRPWQAMFSDDEVRSSFRSALTTTSSHMDTTSTERSSVLTKGTSITESTVDLYSRPGSKADGMTVDDAIEMYAAGFADEDTGSLSQSRDTSLSEEERRRSTRISEAIQDSIGSRGPTTNQSTTLTAMTADDLSRCGSQQPPSILPPTSNRDQYGFLKASHYITVQQYDVWLKNYLLSQERRSRKWISYMRERGLPTHTPTRFPSRSTKTERFIRKGIPPAWRGDAWFFYADGDTYLKKHPGLYSSLISRSEIELSQTDKEAIERDLHRTFPDNIHFKPDSDSSVGSTAEAPLLNSLRNVLRAFALYSPRVGYCQSLNFLAGLLLLFLAEEKAFWMLHIITTVYLPGTHELSLEGTNVDLWTLMVALKSTLPHIWAKVGAAGGTSDDIVGTARLPPISLCTTSWFMSLFIGTLPIESVLRVWDVLFYEGSRTLFRVALTIFKVGEQRIKDVSDSMELFQVVQGLPRGMLDASALMSAVCRRGGVGGEWVEAKRWERREWFAQERARTASEVELIATEGDGPPEDRDGLATTDSTWRRTRKGALPQRQMAYRVEVQ